MKLRQNFFSFEFVKDEKKINVYIFLAFQQKFNLDVDETLL